MNAWDEKGAARLCLVIAGIRQALLRNYYMVIRGGTEILDALLPPLRNVIVSTINIGMHADETRTAIFTRDPSRPFDGRI